MTDRAPTFSIVIPTRNRAGLLRSALTTAMRQTVDDYEVVVVDNSSDDDTRRMVDEVGDGRVRYVRTDRVLALPDNWEFGVEQARGEWVTLLADDDGLVPSLLERAGAHLGDARAVSWTRAAYRHPDVAKAAVRNWLTVYPFSGAADVVASAPELRRLFERRERPRVPHERPPLPKMLDCLAHRDVLRRMREARGRVFGRPGPDYAFCAAYLALEPSFVALDLPLCVVGVAAQSIGAGFDRDTTQAREFVREFRQEALFEFVPLSSVTNANIIAESMLRVKSELPSQLDAVDLDWSRYFVTCWHDLQKVGRHADADAAIVEWRAALRAQPRRVRAQVRRDLLGETISQKVTGLRRAATDRFGALRAVRRLARERDPDRMPFRHISGAEAGFGDLEGAAAYTDRALLPPTAGAYRATADRPDMTLTEAT